MINYLLKTSLILLLMWSSFANAEQDPLTIKMRTIYPEEMTTVADATNYLLEPLGYRLVTYFPAPIDSQELAQQPIKPIARLHRIASIYDALLVLVGEENYIVVDHKHKLVSFTRELR